MKHDIVALAALSPPEIMEELESTYRVHRLWEAKNKEAFLSDIDDRVEIVVTTGIRGADKVLMDALPKLRLVSVYGVGLDAVDLGTARERKIQVTFTPGVLTEAVADLAVGLIFAASRRIAEGDRFVRSGAWAEGRKLGLGWSLRQRKAGLLGFGRIGREIARMLRVFDMQIFYTEPRPLADVDGTYVADLRSLAEQVDILIIAAGGDGGTRGLVDRNILRALGPTGLLVNIARGSVINEVDLAAAIEADELGGAALDVFANEPNVPVALLQSERVVLTPHIASATYEARLAMGRLVLDNVAAFVEGLPLISPVPGTD